MTENELIARYLRANEEYGKVSKELGDWFLPQIRAALDTNNPKLADELRRRIPVDCVYWAFAMDMIREYNKKSLDK